MVSNNVVGMVEGSDPELKKEAVVFTAHWDHLGVGRAVVGDSITCAGPPDTIAAGSSTVMIGGTPAARVGDSTAHGGSIVLGDFTVMIG